MTPPERITTAQLTLRRWAVDDAPALRAALDASDAHLRPWIPFMRDEPRTLEQTRVRLEQFVREFDQGPHLRYAVWTRGSENTELVGEVMLLARPLTDDPDPSTTTEAGYWIHVDHVGHGYATEATRPLIELGFALGKRRVVLLCDPENIASNAVAAKLGAVAALDLVEASLRLWEVTPAQA